MLSGLSRCGGSGGAGTWAGLYIDTSAAPPVVNPYPDALDQIGPFNTLTADCFFRTDDSTMWSLFTTDRTSGDVSLVVHKGSSAYAFYAEAGCRVVPSGGGGFAGVDITTLFEGVEVFMEYTGPDVSVDPAGSTEKNTAPQEWRGVWDSPANRLDSVWFTRSSMWVDDNSAAGDDWTFTMDLVSRASGNPPLNIMEAYLHVFAVPVTSGIITTTLPHT